MNWRKILIGSWSWKRPFYSLASIYLILLVIALFFTNKLVFRPPDTPYPDERSHFIEIPSPDSSHISAAYLPPDEGMPTLLWSHGNAENLGSLADSVEGFKELGFGILAYDYPGYGESPGSPSEPECQRAIKATYQHLVGPLKCPPEEIILMGQSVGTGPTCWLAAREKHGGVILISPFLSAFRSATRIPIFPGDIFPNLNEIPKVSTPLLVIHGEQDSVIPHAQGKEIFELSPSEKKTFLSIAKAGHNDIFHLAPTEIIDALQLFAQTVVP